MAPSIAIYWGGNIVNGDDGVGYVGGMSRNVQMERELYYYGALLALLEMRLDPMELLIELVLEIPCYLNMEVLCLC